MCESWIYGCGHMIDTSCPRPKSTTTIPTINTGGSGGGGSSNLSSSTHSSPRRSSNATASSKPSADLTPLSKFCNGFPHTPKPTTAPCYSCILADAKRKIQLEKPEVEAKKEELRTNGMARTFAKGPDGRYGDDYKHKIVAEEYYEQEFASFGGQGGHAFCAGYTGPGGGGRWPDRGFTVGQGYSNGNDGFGRTAYGNGWSEHGVNGGQDRRNSSAGAYAGNGGGFRGGHGAGLANGFRIRNDTCINGNGRSLPNGLGIFSSVPSGTTANTKTAARVATVSSGVSPTTSAGQNVGLGHGPDGSMYQHNSGNFHGRRF